MGRILSILFLFAGQLWAETIKDRFLSDPSFQVYSVIFELTQNEDGSIKTANAKQVVDPRTKQTVKVELPESFLGSAREEIGRRKYELHLKDQKIAPFYVYFFYAPQLKNGFVDDLQAELPRHFNLPEDKPQSLTHDEVSDFDRAIAPYVEKARATFPDARRRWEAGLPPKFLFFVTTRLRDKNGKWEQVFITVTSIAGGEITGTISSDLTTVKEFKRDESYTFHDSELLDWTILDPDGNEEGNVVGKFLDTYRP